MFKIVFKSYTFNQIRLKIILMAADIEIIFRSVSLIYFTKLKKNNTAEVMLERTDQIIFFVKKSRLYSDKYFK